MRKNSNRVIPVMSPVLPPFRKVKKYLKLMDKNRVYSNYGPLLELFEKRLAEYFKVDKNLVVVCSSATSAIENLCEMSLKDSFVVPDYTFIATGLAVLNSGKKLLLDDVDLETWQLSPSQNYGTNVGFVTVLPFGGDIILDEQLQNREVIIDAAASIGNPDLVSKIPNLPKNQTIVFSLHATKILGIGEGGVVVFPNILQADKFRKKINFGFDENRISQQISTNSKLSEISAAYGLAFLDNIDLEFRRWLMVREKIKKIERKLSREQKVSSYSGVNPYWIFQFKNIGEIEKIRKELERSRIQYRNWWGFGCYSMPSINSHPHTELIKNENAKILSSTCLGLPYFKDISSNELNRISIALESGLKKIE